MAEVYHNNIIDIDLESGTLFRSFLNHTIGSGDNNANWYGVRVFRKGEPIALSGCSVQGLFMPASGAAILISDGTHTRVSGNEAAVLLPQACYNVKGQFTLTIKIIGTNSYSITDTVRIIDGVVADTYSENPVAPTAAVPTYQEILAVYDQMVAAKDGSVRFDIDQTLTAAQMTQARGNIAAASESDVSDLNSALNKDWFRSLNLLGYAKQVLSDANDAEPNSIHRVVESEMNYYPANMPTKYSGYLITLRGKAKDFNQYFWYQYATDDKFNILYTRSKIGTSGESSGTWQAWKRNGDLLSLTKSLDELFIMPGPNLVEYRNVTNGYYVDYANGGRGANSTYSYVVIPVVAGKTYKIVSEHSGNYHIACFNSYNIATANYVGGYLSTSFTAPNGAIYATISLLTTELPTLWCNETDLYVKPFIRPNMIQTNEIRVEKDGSGDFTKLTDALAYGMAHRGTTIYLGPGTYDIIEELGSTYFENFTYAAFTNMGPMIGNGTHLICSQKSKIVCHYTGNNQEVEMGFSPFNPSAANSPKGIGDFIIEGANIEASRVRYIVHDDIGIQTIPYKHEYIRCRMTLDNSQNTHHTHAHSLGGGMGIDGVIVVKDCVFDGISSDNMFVAWHNDNYTQQQMGFIEISGCYFKGTGSIQIHSIGTWPDKTPCLIHDNNLGSAIDYGYSSGSSIDNFEMLTWNNVVRS